MSSTSPFAFDVDTLNTFVAGDLGIADSIFDATITPVANGITDPKTKANFILLSTPNKNSGLWAVEKTFVSGSLELLKPHIELVRTCLEMFGHLQYVETCITGGLNPINDPNSFINTYTSNQAQMATFKTGYEPSSTLAVPNPPKPPQLFLGYFTRSKDNGDVSPSQPSSSLLTSTTSNSSDGNNQWPQYVTESDYQADQLNLLTPKISFLDSATQQLIITGREDSLSDEFSDMESQNQLVTNFQSITPSNIAHYYRIVTLNYQGFQVDVDPEEDYDITIVKKTSGTDGSQGYLETFTITATLKQGAQGGTTEGSGFPDPLLPANLLKASKYYTKYALPVIVNKYVTVLHLFDVVISDPVNFIGPIIKEKLIEFFEMFDPTLNPILNPGLKALPSTDPNKIKYLKYWTSDNKFVLDGTTSINIGLMDITLIIKDGEISFIEGKLPPPVLAVKNKYTIISISLGDDFTKSGAKINANGTQFTYNGIQPVWSNGSILIAGTESPNIKVVLCYIAMTLNFSNGLLSLYKTLLTKLFKIKNIPVAYNTFLTFSDFKDLLKKDAVFTDLGATNDDVTTVPFFNAGVVNSTVIDRFKKMIIGTNSNNTTKGIINDGFMPIQDGIMNTRISPDPAITV